MRMTWTRAGAFYSVPMVAAYVTALGAAGVLVALVGVVALLTRGGEGGLWFVLGMLGFMSMVMWVAGWAASRSQMIRVWVDGDMLHWSDRGRENARPRASVTLMLGAPIGGYGYRRLPVHRISLVTVDRLVLVDDLGGSVVQGLANARLGRVLRALALQPVGA